jgi:hypothetical protein
MCLTTISDREETLNKCHKDILNGRKCFVGYKILRKERSPNDLKWKLSTTVLNKYQTEVVQGWNERVINKRKYIMANRGSIFYNKGRRYPVGCHVYVDELYTNEYLRCLLDEEEYGFKQSVRTGHKLPKDMEIQIIMIPVYFYEEDILATGAQHESVLGSCGEYISTVVVSRYYVKQRTYRSATTAYAERTVFV